LTSDVSIELSWRLMLFVPGALQWAWHTNYMLKPLGGHPQLPRLPMRRIFLARHCTLQQINFCLYTSDVSEYKGAFLLCDCKQQRPGDMDQHCLCKRIAMVLVPSFQSQKQKG
jgi:hypothetical protein